MRVLVQIALVAGGSALGGLTRWGVGVAFARWLGTALPYGTFFINITGSLFLGWFSTVMAERWFAGDHAWLGSDDLRLALAVGFTGAYTTFSTFEWETHGLLRDGEVWASAIYSIGSVVLGLVAVRLGVALARGLQGARAMHLEGEQILLRIWLRNTDRTGWRNAADALVESARHEGLAGATQLRGIAGVDFSGRMLGAGRWSIVEHVPVIVEVVDNRDAIGRFLSRVSELAPQAVATLERAHVLVYRQNRDTSLPSSSNMPPDLPGAIAPLSSLPSTEEYPIMKTGEDGQLLRVFVSESDKWQGEPLASVILHKVHELGLAGATVLRGVMGFGAGSHVHSSRLVELSTDLPVVIEIVDTADKLHALLPFLDESVREGLITIENVRVLKFRAE